MNTIVIILFAAMLGGCIITDIPILLALTAGYAVFAAYAMIKGFGIKDVLKMSWNGIKTAKNILITFILIGIMTSLWRACGTIPVIVCYAAKIISPGIFVMLAFLLCCAVSFLTGTAFGTAATMGVICMSIANSMGINTVVMGGAILGGAYFGDRCSPVSTSALLVSEITATNIYKNIKNMLKTAVFPLVLSCGAYLLYGLINPPHAPENLDISSLFTTEFQISSIYALPAVTILVLAFFKVNVKINMLISILISAVLCIFGRNISIIEILEFSVNGFVSQNSELAPIINGGGIVSMLKAAAIVCISSSYSGIFRATDLLEPIKKLVSKAENKFSAYSITLTVSIVSAMVACNQTLTIMLTNELCNHTEADKSKFALYLENSAVLVAPLIPWSIAGGVPLASVEAPTLSIIGAVFLYLLPICSLIIFRKKKS